MKMVGTITRSSKFLCKSMIRHIDFANADVIVELGAGDGVVTRHILENMHDNATLLSFEIHPAFCDLLRQIPDSRLVVVEDAAENMAAHLDAHNIKHIDYVVSALPFVNFPDEDALHIISECKRLMKSQGRYIQIHYSLLAKKLYEQVFGNVKVHFMPLNMPPAFVLVSEK